MSKEMVNHPDHYKSGGMEVIDVIESFNLGFCLGNVVKYVLRCGKKDSAVQELKKARWYLDREIANMEREHTESMSSGPRMMLVVAMLAFGVLGCENRHFNSDDDGVFCHVIEVSSNGRKHQYLRFDRGITHLPNCKFCQEEANEYCRFTITNYYSGVVK